MKLTFLKSPSDRTLRAISFSKNRDRLYIKKELLEYLKLDTKSNGQLSVAINEDGNIVIIDNSYYNNFRYTIAKEGNPHIYVKGTFDYLPENSVLTYTLETTSIGDKEDTPYILIKVEEETDTFPEEVIDKEEKELG